MDKEIFKNGFSQVASYLGITGINTLTIKLYYEQLNNIPENYWDKTVKYLIKTWKYKHLPLIADFLEAYKAIKPTESSYKPDTRDDKAFNPMTQIQYIVDGLKCQDIIKKQLLFSIFGEGYNNGYDYTKKRDMLKEFLAKKINAGECWSRETEKWIKKEDAVVKGNYYFYPEKFGW